jgi:hypothetical protein
LWLHITASLSLICRSHGSQRAFRLRHEPYSKINLDCKIFCAAPASHSFCPTSSMPCLRGNLGKVHVDIFRNNLTTKNVGCKICIVVEITLESKWMISRKAFSTNRSWKKMCMRFWACPSQCQDLTLKEVNKVWESYDPKRIVVGGPKFLALNEIDLKVILCNIKDCTGWSTHWIIDVKVVLAGRWYIYLNRTTFVPSVHNSQARSSRKVRNLFFWSSPILLMAFCWSSIVVGFLSAFMVFQEASILCPFVSKYFQSHNRIFL